MTHPLGRTFNARSKLIALSEYIEVIKAEAERPLPGGFSIPDKTQRRMAEDVPALLGAFTGGDPSGAEDLFCRVRAINGDNTYGIWVVPRVYPTYDNMNFAEIFEAGQRERPPSEIYVTGKTLRTIAPYVASGLRVVFPGVGGLESHDVFSSFNAVALRTCEDQRPKKELIRQLRPLEPQKFTMTRKAG